MGAEGSISIYDKEILEAITGRKFGWADNGHTYIHEIFGRVVVTDYEGDNLWTHYCLFCGKDDCADDPKENYKVYLEHLEKIKPAFITNWEVWT